MPDEVLNEGDRIEATARQVVLSRLDELYKESLAAFRASQDPLVRIRRTAEAGGDPYQTVTEEENRGGDPRFLGQALQALTAIRDMLGLDEPRPAAEQVVTLKAGAAEHALAESYDAPRGTLAIGRGHDAAVDAGGG